MFGEGEDPARPGSALPAEQKEAVGRRVSEPISSNENQESDLPRQDQMPEIQDPSMEHASLSSSGAVGASEVVIPTTSAEQEQAVSEVLCLGSISSGDFFTTSWAVSEVLCLGSVSSVFFN
ncbi:MAG: hypothetical protein WCO92_06275, partial [Verrucomicrobiota bacterium]